MSQPALQYLVCATPRSGSTLLCEGLSATGIAGRPEEYFQAMRSTERPRQPQEYFSDLEDPSLGGRLRPPAPGTGRSEDGPALLARAREQSTTSNDVFGAKLMWGYLEEFLERFEELPDRRPSTFAARVEHLLPDVRYIRVVRREKLRQAISLWRALQTQSWRDEKGEDDGPERESEFDYEAIHHLTRQLFSHERGWREYFEATRSRPLIVPYEELYDGYEATIRKVLRHLGLDGGGVYIAAPPLQTQSDDTTEDWLARYQDELGRRLGSRAP